MEKLKIYERTVMHIVLTLPIVVFLIAGGFVLFLNRIPSLIETYRMTLLILLLIGLLFADALLIWLWTIASRRHLCRYGKKSGLL